MEKTLFAGLTVLEADESIYADNSAFISRDRVEIDRDLKIGVKTHRHDGSDGLLNPAIAPSGAVIGSGGSIPAGLSVTLGYTFEDAQGGETALSPTLLLTTPTPILAPTSAPTGSANYTAGSLDADTFTYAVTWSDGEGGETPIGPSLTITRDPGFANGRIILHGLNVGLAEAGAVAWRLYRARAGGEYVFLTEGTSEAFIDDGSTPAQCDVHPPNFNINTTGGTNQIEYNIPDPGELDPEPIWINLYASQSGDFAESCLLMQVPIGSAGTTLVFPTLELLDWQPPDGNRSYGGANKIDPDNELIDWHWKRPVNEASELPTEEEGAEEGDVRMVVSERKAYVFTEGEWKTWVGGSGSSELLEASGMGFIFIGEDLTKARPEGFKCVTWMTEGEPGEPENMAEHDILIELP